MSRGSSLGRLGAGLRGSRAWPAIRAVGRPVRSRLRLATAASRATRRRAMRRVSAVATRARRRVQSLGERRPIVGDLTWRPIRRARTALRRGLVDLSDRSIRRDPDGAARVYLDDAWYIGQHPEAAGDPWAHYRAIGVAEGAAPNPVFDVATYRYDHPDVADHGGDPLVHWVLVGRRAGATPHPLFDAAWYRRRHADVGRTEPYLHYLRIGRAERRATSVAVDPGMDIATAQPVLTEPDRVRVTIVVPGYRALALTIRCLYALGRRTPPSLGARVLVVDDDPTRPLGAHLASIPGLTVRANAGNLGFLRSCNNAVAGSDPEAEHVVLLNNDTVVEPGWLEALLRVVDGSASVGMVGARLIEANGRLQEAGVIMDRDAEGVPYGRGDDPDRPQYRYTRDVDAVSGSCLLIRRAAWDAMGGFDDAFAPAFFEEYDLAFRLRAAGWRVVYEPACTVHHTGSASYGITTRDAQTRRNRARFIAAHRDALAAQPAGEAVRFLSRERPHPGGVALVIDDRVPEADRHAGALLTRQHLQLLGDAGIKAIFRPHDGEPREPALSELRAAGVEVLAPGVDMPAWLADHGRDLDWVMVARPHIAEHWLPMLRRWTDARIVYFTHDLHHLRERRRAELTGDPRAHQESLHLEAIERRVLTSVDAILTPSAAEVEPIRAMAPGRPVGVLGPYVERSADATPVDPPLAHRRGVMFLGGFEHLPNIDAAVFLVRDIMPLVWPAVPDARVLIVGSDPTAEVLALASERVTVTGYVPDLAPWFAQARMTVSALRYGSGLKGKIVASMEAGVPVITTAIGNEGLDLHHGEQAMLGETADELASAILRLFAEPGLADRLALAGHAVVDGRYTRSAAAEALRMALGPRRDRGARP